MNNLSLKQEQLDLVQKLFIKIELLLWLFLSIVC